MEDLCGELEERRKGLHVKTRKERLKKIKELKTIESSDNLEFYPSRAGALGNIL